MNIIEDNNMFEMRYAADRGKADFGWLRSRHTFSFASYYDPAQMGFSALRVINDDTVAPGAGFDTHGHKDMEILSLVLSGSIAHKDSAGHTEVLPAGEFQLMSAGQGIYHSEFNASKTAALKFLQIWLQPDQFGGKPGYQQKDFGQRDGLSLILSPDGRDGSLIVRQNALLYQLILPAAAQQPLSFANGRKGYIHLISGELEVAGNRLTAGDGIKITAETAVQLSAQSAVKALVFDLP
jgi:quercetin 2,3-dioxygenase